MRLFQFAPFTKYYQIEINVNEIRWKCVDWTQLAHDRIP
jgi:hypothetical protein